MSAMPQISLYGFSNNLLENIAGELLISVIFLVITVIIIALNTFLKYEKLRLIKSKLRQIWNGYFFMIMPRLAIFSGFQIRLVTDTDSGVLNAVITSIVFIILIAYFVTLLMQVRKLNSRI
jgi:hypothetical protein